MSSEYDTLARRTLPTRAEFTEWNAGVARAKTDYYGAAKREAASAAQRRWRMRKLNAERAQHAGDKDRLGGAS